MSDHPSKKYLPITIVVLVLLALAVIYVGKALKNNPSLDFTKTGQTSQSGALADLGAAPEFANISQWLNTPAPITMASLKGKVVLIDFWTYSCINCIRTLPYVTKWYDTYKDKGLVVIGVHTPEFGFEKVADNVKNAIARFHINYPVPLDNDYGTWNAYGNQYWPAEYLIDQKGEIVHTNFGEGEYDVTENAIRTLLGLNADVPKDNGPDLSGIQSPEMYFELPRLANLTPNQTPSQTPADYKLPANVELNNFALSGIWQFDQEKATLTKGPGSIKLVFSAGQLNFVASADKPITITVKIDGKITKTVQIHDSQLYNLFDSTDYTQHTAEIEIPDGGLHAFTFTFG